MLYGLLTSAPTDFSGTVFVEPMNFGIAGILIGLLLIFLGRKLFWFLIAAVGFYAGLIFAINYLNVENDWHGIVIALLSGMIGVIVLYLLQKIALSVVGFLGGVLATFYLLQYFQVHLHWWLLIGGGVFGLIAAAWFFQFALILLSAFFGSYVVVRELPLEKPMSTVLFLLLSAAGILVQNSMMHKRKREKKPNGPRN